MNNKKNLFLIHETQKPFPKSAKTRVTGTIPYCHGKVPHSRKLLSLCSNDFKGVLFFLNQWICDEKLFQGNSDIMIDSCTYIYTSFSKGYDTSV